MKALLRFMIVLGIVLILTSCATKVVYRDRYQALTPNDSLIQSYSVSQPPMMSSSYSILSFEQKETILTSYIQDLLVTIGYHNADKLGLRTWKSDLTEKIDKLNKEQENKK